jgi:hypothetical protein
MPKIKRFTASILNPLKVACTSYRFAFSLCETNKYQINIIGFSEKYMA